MRDIFKCTCRDDICSCGVPTSDEMKAEIKSLQAEIRKKDQELDALRKSWFVENQARELAEAEMRSEAKARTKCEKELVEQQAYIGRLESKFLELAEADLWDSTYNADGATAHIVRNKQAAKEALEKVRTG